MKILCAKCQTNEAPMSSYGPVWCKSCRGTGYGNLPKTNPTYEETRRQDWEEVERGLKSPDPNERRQAERARRELKIELGDSYVKSARQALLKETLNGNKENVWDIRDRMVRQRGGRMGSGNLGSRASFFFSL